MIFYLCNCAPLFISGPEHLDATQEVLSLSMTLTFLPGSCFIVHAGVKTVERAAYSTVTETCHNFHVSKITCTYVTQVDQMFKHNVRESVVADTLSWPHTGRETRHIPSPHMLDSMTVFNCST